MVPVNQPPSRLAVSAGAVTMISARTRPVIGLPSGLRATGTFKVMRLSPGSTSPCQAYQTVV